MANTPFLDLVKPAGTDRALVSVINSNSDKIDTGVSTLSEQIGNKANYLDLVRTADTQNTPLAVIQAKYSDITAGDYVGIIYTSGNRWQYHGYKYNANNGVFICSSYGNSTIVIIRISGGTWSSEELATKNTVDTLNYYKNLGSFDSLSVLTTLFGTELSNMASGESRNGQITCTGAFSVFTNGTVYFYDLKKYSTNFSSCIVQIAGGPTISIGYYRSGTWSFDQITLKSESFVSHSSSSRNWNNLTQAGYHFTYITTSSGTNAPFTGYEGWVFTMIYNDGSYVAQVAIKWSGKTIVSRYLNISTGSWSSWA